MRQYTPDPRVYELMTVLSPDVPEDAITGEVETIAGYVTAAGGTVSETLRDSPWGRRRLAYTMRHAGRDVRDGYYTVYHFEIDPSRVADVERDLKLNVNVIRHMVTHFIPVPLDPQAVLDAEIDAEERAAAAYSAAQLAAVRPAAPAPATAPAPSASVPETPVVPATAAANAGPIQPVATEQSPELGPADPVIPPAPVEAVIGSQPAAPVAPAEATAPDGPADPVVPAASNEEA